MSSTAPEARFVLVDCAHFYVSCERLFRPDLWQRPVVVLSNNDGNLIALSPEARALGLKMGTPYFQAESLIRRHRVAVFSSNFPLYADLSARVMTVLGQFSPEREIYSIDEAFLGLTGNEDEAWAERLRRTVWRWTGIPVRVGIGATKTLAKAAQSWAKRQGKSCAQIVTAAEREAVLPQLPVAEVWGIGPRLAPRLIDLGLTTAWDLSRADAEWLRRRFSVTLARTALELQGWPCLALEAIAPPRRQIRRSRSFRPAATDGKFIASALASFAVRATEKLRQERLQARIVTVFLASDAFDDTQPRYAPVASAALPHPGSDTGRFLHIVQRLFQRLYRPGIRYRKAGVILAGLEPVTGRSLPLDAPAERSELMTVIDAVNRRFPKSLMPAASLTWLRRHYRPRYLSPRYTTRWHQLPKVKAR